MSQKIIEDYERKVWYMLDDTELEEILACMEDSDRYIVQEIKNNIIIAIKRELYRRGHIQY